LLKNGEISPPPKKTLISITPVGGLTSNNHFLRGCALQLYYSCLLDVTHSNHLCCNEGSNEGAILLVFQRLQSTN
jgi:hypothetical protein